MPYIAYEGRKPHRGEGAYWKGNRRAIFKAGGKCAKDGNVEEKIG